MWNPLVFHRFQLEPIQGVLRRIKNCGTMMDKTGRQSEEKPRGKSALFSWNESKVSFGPVDHNHDRQISGRTRPSGRH